jgi:NADH:ubiquinone oxidoreductase subunit K
MYKFDNINTFLNNLFLFHVYSDFEPEFKFSDPLDLQNIIYDNYAMDCNFFLSLLDNTVLNEDNSISVRYVDYLLFSGFFNMEGTIMPEFQINREMIDNFEISLYSDEEDLALITENTSNTKNFENLTNIVPLFNFELIFLFIQGTLLYISLFFTKIHIYLVLLILEMLILVVVLGFLLIDLTNSFAISIAIIIISLAACETALGLSILINRTKYEN